MRNDHLNQGIIRSQQALEDYKLEEKRQITDFKAQNEEQIKEMEEEIIEIRELAEIYDEKINNVQNRIKKE